jgi:hypothetical protein
MEQRDRKGKGGRRQTDTGPDRTNLVEEEDGPGARQRGAPGHGGVEGGGERVEGADAVGADEVLEPAEVGVGDGAVLVGLPVPEHYGHGRHAQPQRRRAEERLQRPRPRRLARRQLLLVPGDAVAGRLLLLLRHLGHLSSLKI